METAMNYLPSNQIDKNQGGLPYMSPVGQGRVFAPFRSENAYITYWVSVWFSTRPRARSMKFDNR